MNFNQLPIAPNILKALADKNYTSPTPIQEKAIPLVLEKHDLLGCAQTGTGKTAAFSIPIIQLIQASNENQKHRIRIQALIVTPTRELAIQINENIAEYAKYTPIKHAVIYGGVKQGKQVNQIKNGIHILVATPGRLLDLQNQGHIQLNQVEIFVLDEADRMLDMGFINDITKLIKLLPVRRQSLFFSATMPDNILKLSRKILNAPKKVETSVVSSAPATLKQLIYFTNKSTKKDLLNHILSNSEIEQVLVFSKTKHGADKITRNLKKKQINAAAIHGDKAQNQRQKALKSFKNGSIRVLVATDIAARGIDIDKLKYVINYDMPDMAETYVHRIGRSGRAGESGTAISICEPEENIHVKEIEKLIQSTLKIIDNHPFPQTDKPMTNAERKEWNKEKQKRKQEFFANRKKNKQRRP
jgi:ATP-dependent RNA helicase RhlE